MFHLRRLRTWRKKGVDFQCDPENSDDFVDQLLLLNSSQVCLIQIVRVQPDLHQHRHGIWLTNICRNTDFFAKTTPSICDPKWFVPHRSPLISAWGHSTGGTTDPLRNQRSGVVHGALANVRHQGVLIWVKIAQVIPESPDSMGISRS